jgi:MerR family transcriptional regulator/heat shock protein HspR
VLEKEMTKRRIGYTISVVAETYGVHPQTLRSYERQGLLNPPRSQGNTRLYSDADLARLEMILNLTRDLGVNLAGVEVVLNMRAKMERMQSDVLDLFEFLQAQFGLDPDLLKSRVEGALVPTSPTSPVLVLNPEDESSEDSK